MTSMSVTRQRNVLMSAVILAPTRADQNRAFLRLEQFELEESIRTDRLAAAELPRWSWRRWRHLSRARHAERHLDQVCDLLRAEHGAAALGRTAARW
jgi:hypothetical protein